MIGRRGEGTRHAPEVRLALGPINLFDVAENAHGFVKLLPIEDEGGAGVGQELLGLARVG